MLGAAWLKGVVIGAGLIGTGVGVAYMNNGGECLLGACDKEGTDAAIVAVDADADACALGCSGEAAMTEVAEKADGCCIEGKEVACEDKSACCGSEEGSVMDVNLVAETTECATECTDKAATACAEKTECSEKTECTEKAECTGKTECESKEVATKATNETPAG